MPSVILSRVIVALIVGILLMLGSIFYFRPKQKAPSDARFMHCDTCRVEMVYNEKLAGGRCPRCQPPKVGMLVATRDSIAGGGTGSPWRSLVIALSFEFVLMLGAVVLILSFPPKSVQSSYGYTQCKNCGTKLRFPASRAGRGAGWCPLCKAMFAYPVEIGEPFHDE